MEPFSTPQHVPALAVTLVSASDGRDSAVVAAALAGRPVRESDWILDRPDSDSTRFAEELLEELARQADDGQTGVVVIALEPAADTMEVGLVLEHLCEARHPGDTRIGLLDIVAVTSAAEVVRVLIGHASRSASPDIEGGAAAERLAARIEFASLIVLTGTAGPTEEELAIDLLRTLAPTAEIIRASEVEQHRRRPARLAPRRAGRLAASLGWQRLLSGACDRGGRIGTHVFRDPLPFHPDRLSAAIATELVPERVGRIVRSRGLVRLATRSDRVGSWSIAGDVVTLDPTTLRSWDPDSPVGQEIAFIGLGLERRELTRVLQRCLLTPEELLAGPDAWARLVDPFPRWEDEHQH